jgi:hypothetical protein
VKDQRDIVQRDLKALPAHFGALIVNSIDDDGMETERDGPLKMTGKRRVEAVVRGGWEKEDGKRRGNLSSAPA